MKYILKIFSFMCIPLVMTSCRNNSNVSDQFSPIDSLIRNAYPNDSSLEVMIESKRFLFNQITKLNNYKKIMILEKPINNLASYEGLIYSFPDSAEYSYSQQNGKVKLTRGNQFGDNSNFKKILEYTKQGTLLKLDSMEKNPTGLMHMKFIYVYYLDYTNYVFRRFKLI